MCLHRHAYTGRVKRAVSVSIRINPLERRTSTEFGAYNSARKSFGIRADFRVNNTWIQRHICTMYMKVTGASRGNKDSLYNNVAPMYLGRTYGQERQHPAYYSHAHGPRRYEDGQVPNVPAVKRFVTCMQSCTNGYTCSHDP
jgi:hypothetical protein